jgi:hypothetical protein
LQQKEQDYLLPVDADDEIMVEADVETTSIDAQSTLNRFASKASHIPNLHL